MTSSAAPRAQTRGEEIANALSHGIAVLLAAAALPLLVHGAASQGRAADVAGAALFAGTMIVLYLVSTLYHAMPAGRAKARLNRLDHASIYLFIAGSNMPFLLGVLRGAWGWSLFGVVWAAAALVAAAPLVERMSTAGPVWLVAGGLSYTAGAVVFLFDSKWRYAHFAWHLFVMGGTTCHFFAVLWHAQGG
ncbi:hemolysin III family protein [uncultured Piscinibacter sp.]|uniref:PAQR family membrane homeostasis protein TrhA n=1 Tax=uncultured Piscinibacter sp. TaxID=1131835 RepID=UPI0026127A32|nr:hemolysin III family protein [uncultured Piscinibacter sp.]